MEEYYQEMVQLQEKLRKSEQQRFLLEEKFNEMMRHSRDAEQERLRILRHKYHKFIEQDRRRQERNAEIFRTLERIETRAANLAAKTNRYRHLRQQYALELKNRQTHSTHPKNINNLTQSDPQLTQSNPNCRRNLFPSYDDKAESYDSKIAKSKINLLERYIKENNDTERFLNNIADKIADKNVPKPNYDQILERIIQNRSLQNEFQTGNVDPQSPNRFFDPRGLQRFPHYQFENGSHKQREENIREYLSRTERFMKENGDNRPSIRVEESRDELDLPQNGYQIPGIDEIGMKTSGRSDGLLERSNLGSAERSEGLPSQKTQMEANSNGVSKVSEGVMRPNWVPEGVMKSGEAFGRISWPSRFQGRSNYDSSEEEIGKETGFEKEGPRDTSGKSLEAYPQEGVCPLPGDPQEAYGAIDSKAEKFQMENSGDVQMEKTLLDFVLNGNDKLEDKISPQKLDPKEKEKEIGSPIGKSGQISEVLEDFQSETVGSVLKEDINIASGKDQLEQHEQKVEELRNPVPEGRKEDIMYPKEESYTQDQRYPVEQNFPQEGTLAEQNYVTKEENYVSGQENYVPQENFEEQDTYGTEQENYGPNQDFVQDQQFQEQNQSYEQNQDQQFQGSENYVEDQYSGEQNYQEQDFQGQELQREEIQGQDCQEQVLQTQKFQGQDLQGQQFQGQDLQGQEFQKQQFQEQQYQGRDLQGQEFQEQQFQEQEYQGQDFQGQDLQGQEFQQQQFQEQEYQGQDFQGQPLQGQEFQEQQFQEQEYQGQDFKGQEFQSQEFQGQDLQEQGFQGQVYPEQQFQGQNLQQQQFQGQEFQKQEFQGQDLQEQEFQDQQYHGQDIPGQEYQGEEIQESIFQGQEYVQEEGYQQGQVDPNQEYNQDQYNRETYQDQSYDPNQQYPQDQQQYPEGYDQQFQENPDYPQENYPQDPYQNYSQENPENIDPDQQYQYDQPYDENYQEQNQIGQPTVEYTENIPTPQQQGLLEDSSSTDNVGNIDAILGTKNDDQKSTKVGQNLGKLLESDTESSLKQDTKVSNDSDFDFSQNN